MASKIVGSLLVNMPDRVSVCEVERTAKFMQWAALVVQLGAN